MILIKFEWLKEYIELEEKISYLEYNLKKSKRELTRWVEGDLANVKLEKESIASSLEEKIKAIEYELSILRSDKEELLDLVNAFEGMDHKVLKGKYIEGKSLEEIAQEEMYSYSHIRRKHAELVRTLHFLEKYENL